MSTGDDGWVEALGRLKEQELKRRSQFEEWAETIQRALDRQRNRANSSQRLISSLKASIDERIKVDEEYVQRLVKVANARDETSFGKHSLDSWHEDDRSYVCFLTDLQRYVASMLELNVQAMRRTLGESPLFGSWAPQFATSVTQNITAAEKALQIAWRRHNDVVVYWAQHEAQCRDRLTGCHGCAPAAVTDLWGTEMSYRRELVEFERDIYACEVALTRLWTENEDAAVKRKAFLLQTLSDVTQRIAQSHSSIYGALQAPAGCMLPTVPGVPSRDEQKAPAKSQLPTKWANFVMPPSTLVLRQGSAEQPPRSLNIFGGWKPVQILLTIDGYVHCFAEDDDSSIAPPMWSVEVRSAEIEKEAATSTFTLVPFSGSWREKLQGRTRHIIRLPGADALEAWDTALRPWWRSHNTDAVASPSHRSPPPSKSPPSTPNAATSKSTQLGPGEITEASSTGNDVAAVGVEERGGSLAEQTEAQPQEPQAEAERADPALEEAPHSSKPTDETEELPQHQDQVDTSPADDSTTKGTTSKEMAQDENQGDGSPADDSKTIETAPVEAAANESSNAPAESATNEDASSKDIGNGEADTVAPATEVTEVTGEGPDSQPICAPEQGQKDPGTAERSSSSSAPEAAAAPLTAEVDPDVQKATEAALAAKRKVRESEAQGIWGLFGWKKKPPGEDKTSLLY